MKLFNWINLILGAWILISPWVLGFSALNTALWSNVAAGILVVVLSLWQLFGGNIGGGSSGPTMPQQ